MRRMVRGVMWLCAIALLLVFLAEPIALAIAKKQLRTIFFQARVSIARCDILPLSGLKFTGIRIQKERMCDIVINEARISYGKELLLKFALREASLSGVSISVTLGPKSILRLKDGIQVPVTKSPFVIERVRLSGVHCDIASKELNCKGDFSLAMKVPSRELDELKGTIRALDGLGLYLENASFVIPALPAGAENFSIDLIKYGKVKLTEIAGNVRLQGRSLLLYPLKAKLFGGSLRIKASMHFEKKNAYEATLDIRDVDLAKLTRELELEEKVQLSGTLQGQISARGQGTAVHDLQGELTTGAQGGVVRVKDATLLGGASSIPMESRTLAKSLSAQDILVESLKDYHYNTGLVKLRMQEGDLICDVALRGEAGKRNLTTVVHDFSIKGGLR